MHQQKQQVLLNNLLPQHLLEKFLNNPNERQDLTDRFDDATILFADISQFTAYSSSVEPEQVVNMLQNLFTEFDASVVRLNVFKLYTIGDCYVVLGVVDKNNRNIAQEALNVVYMGLAMIQIIRRVRTIINFEELDMRIGVHTGSFIGGVTGTDVVRFDIYGGDVLIANKMESGGERGQVLVSEVTKDILQQNFPNQFIYEKRVQKIKVQSLNKQLDAYFVGIPEDSEYESSEASEPSQYNKDSVEINQNEPQMQEVIEQEEENIVIQSLEQINEIEY